MANSNLKVTCKDYNVEIEGLDELIYKIFTDLREYGFSAISKVEVSDNSNTDAPKETGKVIDNVHSISETKALPDLNILILEKRRFTQSQWMLLIAWYCSHHGKIFFTKKDVKKMYTSLRKYTRMKTSDFSTFFIQLIYNNYISQVDAERFELSSTGFDKSVELLSDKEETAPELKTNIG